MKFKNKNNIGKTENVRTKLTQYEKWGLQHDFWGFVVFFFWLKLEGDSER